ncbi:hypothetical protein [Vulcanisaeta souniana]|uniref:hypothetical protein n=1 Tax=Vulcanisaeta souniana TaxID=164452 RepID=UPI000A460CB4|nr:hypothetical protein [Vulcanisaeta souniana]
MLYAFYKDPEKFIKDVEGNSTAANETEPAASNNQEIPEDVLKLDEEFTNPFKHEIQ